MKIDTLNRVDLNSAVRIAARIVWEDSDRPGQEIFFEAQSHFADGLSRSVHPFVVAACIAALKHRERRLAVEGTLCPELRMGLESAMRLLHHWYGREREPIVVEARMSGELTPAPRRRAAFFFTGGVDSLATLRANRNVFPSAHPGYFRDGLLIFGLEVENTDAFNCVVEVLSPLAEESGLTLIPISTNVRSLDESWRFWTDEFEAAALAAAAHALDGRLASATIASSFDHASLHPHGSHPMLDPSYSSSVLQVRHDGVGLSRLEKLRLLAEWESGLRALRVCNRPEAYRPGILNCGVCEKCLRTLTGLLVVDRLSCVQTFASTQVTADLIRANVRITKTNYPFWQELVGPLEAKGLDDLARAIRAATSRYRKRGRWTRSLVALDDLHLDGRLRKLGRALRPASPRPLQGSS